ncbi:hypothetical protein AAMO2058_001021300 [Amorphochlora amoebiformis]
MSPHGTNHTGMVYLASEVSPVPAFVIRSRPLSMPSVGSAPDASLSHDGARPSRIPSDFVERDIPRRPKRARTAFNYFQIDEKKRQGNSPRHREINARNIASRWRSLSPEERKRYNDMASTDKSRFERETEKYIQAVTGQRRGKTTSESVPSTSPSASDYRQMSPDLSSKSTAQLTQSLHTRSAPPSTTPFHRHKFHPHIRPLNLRTHTSRFHHHFHQAESARQPHQRRQSHQNHQPQLHQPQPARHPLSPTASAVNLVHIPSVLSLSAPVPTIASTIAPNLRKVDSRGGLNRMVVHNPTVSNMSASVSAILAASLSRTQDSATHEIKKPMHDTSSQSSGEREGRLEVLSFLQSPSHHLFGQSRSPKARSPTYISRSLKSPEGPGSSAPLSTTMPMSPVHITTMSAAVSRSSSFGSVQHSMQAATPQNEERQRIFGASRLILVY